MQFNYLKCYLIQTTIKTAVHHCILLLYFFVKTKFSAAFCSINLSLKSFGMKKQSEKFTIKYMNLIIFKVINYLIDKPIYI